MKHINNTAGGLQKMLSRQSLKMRISIVMVASLFGLLLCISVTGISLLVSTALSTWQSRQVEAARNVQNSLNRLLQDNISHLYYLEAVVQANKNLGTTPVGELLEARPGILEATILDEKGNVIYSEAQGVSFLANPFTTTQSVWYQQAAKGQTYIGEIEISKDSEPYLVLAVPTLETTGVIVARFDMQMIDDVISDIHVGETDKTYLINQSGLIVAQQNSEQKYNSAALVNTRVLDKILGSNNEYWSGFYKNNQNQWVIGLSYPVSDTKWIIVTELSLYETFELSLKVMIGVLIGMIGLYAALIILGKRYLQIRLFTPINSLQEGADRIAQGDLDHPIPVTHQDELGKVAQTINIMSGRLKERTRELEEQAVSLAAEINERQKAENQLLYDAFHDSLTHLANRALLMDRLQITLLRSKQRERSLFALMLLDFDRFKNINDSLGHVAGDQLLIDAAYRLEKCARSSDTVARLGADEFIILIEDINSIHDATRFADRLFEDLSIPFLLGNNEITVTFSMGIVIFTPEYENADEILRDADTALNRAKLNGKGRYEIFDSEMRENILGFISLETELRRAIDTSQLVLYYQPVVDLRTNIVRGFEALVRWNHPSKGLISPDVFIPIAEETGLIIPIGQFVINEAIAQLHRWQQKFYKGSPLKMSINLSQKQLAYEGLVGGIEQTLGRYQVDPASIGLEITETAYMYDVESGINTIKRLKSLGVNMLLDDFGTGYSSLSQLSHLSFDEVKIDRFFIDQMTKDDKHTGLIRAIISMSHELGMDIVAEGIENQQQVNMLTALGCEFGQGYYFARPQESKYAESLIARSAGEPFKPASVPASVNNSG